MVPITRMSAADFDEIVSVNLRGAWLMARAEIRAMMEAGSRGSIIGTSSFVASASTPGTSNYAASKAGLEAMTRALAMEFGPQGIRVNAIAPGATEAEMFSGSGVDDDVHRTLTDHTPLRRLGQGADMAEAALWLATDDRPSSPGRLSLLMEG
jgi:NAD(P)-dependent dehydrogenase (short-subunit alcohol dehydrogenase family)